MTAEQISRLIAATTSRADALIRETSELANQLQVSDQALRAFLQSLGEAQVPPEKLAETLAEIANRYNLLQAELADRSSENPAINRLMSKAREALDGGKLDRVDGLLRTVAGLQDAEIERLQKQSATTAAQLGGIAFSRLQYVKAAQFYAQAAARLPSRFHELMLQYLEQEGRSLYLQGVEFGDNDALKDAIYSFRRLVQLRANLDDRLAWAETQRRLGAALTALGAREPGTARLEEAVAAFRNALLESTRERVPLDWAMTQNDLGNALATLGEREPGTARLEEAVAAFRNALLESTRERVPLQWAMTQNNLGVALRTLGEREPGTARLEEAVAAFRNALLESTRERVPLDWATTQNNLGETLLLLFERRPDTSLLDEAEVATVDARQVLVEEAGLTQYTAHLDNLLAQVAALRSKLGAGP